MQLNQLKKIFFNHDNQLRNGWWVMLFIGLIVLTQFIYKPITNGLRNLSMPAYLVDAVSVSLVLCVTFICMRLRKQNMHDVGIGLDAGWLKLFVLGLGLGGLWLLVSALPLWLLGGVSFALDPERSVSILISGFYAFFLAGLLEELLHRGFIFQRLIDGIGFWPAQLIIALVFALGHWDNPQMDGITSARALLDLALASIVFGLAYYKTKSLALPTGLHIGWNWVQGNIMGFNVSGYETHGWFKASLTNDNDWFTGGQFGVEGSLFSIVVSLLLIICLQRWNGFTPKQMK